MEWINVIIEQGDLPTALVVVAVLLLTGGVGASIVNGISASRRGIKGDALVQEQNGIDGLSKLSNAQDVAIKRLDGQVSTLTARLEAMERELRAEREFSNKQIALLIKHGIPPAPRT